MKPTIFVDRRLPEPVLNYLREHCEVKTFGADEKRTRENILSHMDDCEGLFISSSEAIDASFLQAAPKLKVVSTMSVGYNHFHLDALREKAVIGTHTPYVLDETVADLLFALMLDSARRISELDRYVKQGNWIGNEGRSLFGQNVHHKTIGIIGAGRIGEALLQRAVHGFNMNALYYNRTEKPLLTEKYNAQYVGMATLLAQSDFVILMTPLSESTYQLLKYEHFKQMKKTAIFINGSRGATIKEEDLVRALDERLIAGAGLDVFEQEPLPPQHPFLAMNQVVLTPHIGSAVDETREAMAMLAAKNLVHALLQNGTYYAVTL